MNFETLYEDKSLLAIEKPSAIAVYSLIKEVAKQLPYLKEVGSAPRYGLIHRLDKETSGVLLIAKNNDALKFYQKQFSTTTEIHSRSNEAPEEAKIKREYLALVAGKVKKDSGEIETLIGRSQKNRKKQAVFLPLSPKSQREGLRKAKTFFKTKNEFENFTLLKVIPKTGRRHQIRVHLAFVDHPIAGDKIYGFKNQACPKGLQRLFLHAKYLKVNSKKGESIEIKSKLPQELKKVLENIK